MIEEDYNYTVYSKITGEYIKNLHMPTDLDATLNCDKETEVVVRGGFTSSTYFKDGFVRGCGEKPNEHCTFCPETHKWVDPRDEALIREEHRASFSLARSAIIKALILRGIMGKEELAAVAQGQLPAVFERFTRKLDLGAEIDFRMWWSTAQTVNRVEPQFLRIVENLDISNRDWDDIFGVTDARV